MWLESYEGIQKYGTMLKSPNGHPIQSPHVAVYNRSAELLMRIATEFGFTPASEQRISPPKGETIWPGFEDIKPLEIS